MLNNVRIVNFKAFLDQPLPLSSLTLLTGLNGSGKSSLIQMLLLLRQSWEAGLLERGRLALDGRHVRVGTFKDALFEQAPTERIACVLEECDGSNRHRTEWDFSFSSPDARVSDAVESPAPLLRSSSMFGTGFRFLSAERIGPRVSYSISDLDLSEAGLGVQGEWTAQYLAVHKDSNIAVPSCAHPQAVSHKLVNQVEAWMSEFSPGLRIELEPDESRDSVSIRFRFEARRSVTNLYRPTNVGFGISYTLPVIVAILAARPGDLILLEAPEAHLHPRGQARIGELLSLAAEGGVQILVETHSDHVMNGVRVAIHKDSIKPENATFLYFRFDPKGDDNATTVEVIRPDSHGRIETWPDGFFDEMDRSLEILLAPKGEQS